MSAVLEGNYATRSTRCWQSVRRDGQAMAWTRWVGYNFLGDTLKPLGHIFPRFKLTSFLKGKSVTVDLSQPRRKLSLAIISTMTSNKIKERGPFHRKEIGLDWLCFTELAMALIKMLAADAKVKVKVATEGSRKITSLEVWDQDTLADIFSIHLFKPDLGHGAAAPLLLPPFQPLMRVFSSAMIFACSALSVLSVCSSVRCD